ncbi:MAG: diguanylate cyclase, partial [Lachnospiraceae bacterium]|nr:diguanylate cyclase [Lachnospiraceae bacterium]
MKKWLGLTKDSAFVINEFDHENMRTSMYMCAVIIVLEIWMIISAIYGDISGLRVRSASWLASHIGMYLLLIAIAVLMLVHSVLSLKRKKNHHVQSMILFTVFTIVCVLFGTYISYYDYSKGEQLFTFVALVVFAFCLIVWRPILTIILSGAAFLLMYLLMARVDGASYPTQINFFIMWVCILMCAIGNYSVRISHARRAEHLYAVNEQLKSVMKQDELTGLQNRKCMNEDILELLGRTVLVAMVDVDNFKYVNDTYNHSVGDEVLIRIARKMEEIFSPLRTKTQDHWLQFYRYGGDGFTLFSGGYDTEDIIAHIERLQREMHQEIFEGTDIHVSLSCGISEGTPQSMSDLMDMIRYSDHTLYEAKRLGRMRILSATLLSMQNKEREGKLGKRMLSAHETDPLTGLPNMHYFRSHADRALAEALNDGDKPEFLYFDINNFKEFNDTYGFQSGDHLLRTIAEQLEEQFKDAMVARLSDDHFIVFTTDSGSDNQDKIRHLREVVHVEQREVKLELRVGIYRPDAGEADASLA